MEDVRRPPGGQPLPRRPRTPKSPSNPAANRRKAKQERMAGFDKPFIAIVFLLLAFGFAMMFSSSYSFALREYGDSYYFVKRQLIWAILGLAVMLIISTVDYRILIGSVTRKANFPVVLFLIIALMNVSVRFIGVEQGGAKRWLSIFGITFQPSELLKFALILLLAYIAQKNASVLMRFFKGFVPFALFIAIACALTMLQTHISGTIIIFLIGLAMMIVGGCRLSHIALMCVCLGVLAFVGISVMKDMGYTYFEDRILSWLDPEADIGGKTFQTYQSLITIGSGGWFGLGLGNSIQKSGYLPATQNDFIFSIVCEELGFVGAILIILLFVIFIFRGFYISSHARDRFGMMLGVGITAQIGIQALLNIAVATNSVPNTGISLPFFSYGGTALMMQLAQIGILLNISRKATI